MQLFYDPAIVPPLHTLGEEESKHCIRVLRLGRGATLHIADGRGTLYRCRIVEDDPRRCTVEVVETIPDFERLSYALTVAVAPTKNADRFEWFLEKATEVGIGAVIPLETEHSERRVFKAERSEKIITAAMKQSLKAYRPVLHPLTPFREAIRPGEPVLVCIGPEGDFSPAEVDFALEHGFEEITLGQQRLRTETAALVAVVMTSVVNGSK